MNRQMVENFLPHREPFLFIDEVQEIQLENEHPTTLSQLIGGKIRTSFYAREDLFFFKGHFPGKPIVPGVIQTEIIAQTSCLLISSLDKNMKGDQIDLALMSIDRAKFRRPVLPGMNLLVEAVCMKTRGSIIDCSGKIFYEGQLMSEASVMARVDIKT